MSPPDPLGAGTVRTPVVRIGSNDRGPLDEIAIEHRIRLTVQTMTEDMDLGVHQLSPMDLEDFAVGHLWTELGVHPERIDVIDVDRDQIRVSVEGQLPSDANTMGSTIVSCGDCGSSDLPDATAIIATARAVEEQTVHWRSIEEGQSTMRATQSVFQRTGGVHAAMLDWMDGRSMVREDIGRHTALDKVLGAAMRSGMDPAGAILHLSGRAGSDLIRKACRTGPGIIVAVGAPTSMAVDLARRADRTLICFARGPTGTILSGAHRVIFDD